MEVIGILFGLLNSIAFYTWSVVRKVDDLIRSSEKAIHQEFLSKQKEFGRILTRSEIVEDHFELVTDSIKKIYFNSHQDIHKLYWYRREVNVITPTTIIGFCIVLVSLILGHFQPKNSIFFSLRNQLIFSVPLVFFVVESLIFWRVNKIEKKIKNIQDKYEFQGY